MMKGGGRAGTGLVAFQSSVNLSAPAVSKNVLVFFWFFRLQRLLPVNSRGCNYAMTRVVNSGSGCCRSAARCQGCFHFAAEQ